MKTNEMKRAVERMEQAKALRETPAPEAKAAEVKPAEVKPVKPAEVLPEPVDAITALRRWRLAAGVRFVSKSLHVVKGR